MKKLGFLVLTLIFGLSVMGLGYASWTDTLTIVGNIGTGIWSDGNDFSFDYIATNDPIGSSDPYTSGSWTRQEDGDIEWSGLHQSPDHLSIPRETITISPDGKTLTIEVNVGHNVPKRDYYGSVYCGIKNDGTLPVKIVNAEWDAEGTLSTAGNPPQMIVSLGGVLDEDNDTRIEPGQVGDAWVGLFIYKNTPKDMNSTVTVTFDVIVDP